MTDERKHSLPDDEFEAYLEGRSQVSRGYRRLRDVEPPPGLDQAVLREARAAVKQSARPRGFLTGWLPRVAVAAALVVAVGVALQFSSAPVVLRSPEQQVMADAPVARSVMPTSPSTMTMTAPAAAPLREPNIQRLEIARPQAETEHTSSPAGSDDQAVEVVVEAPRPASAVVAGDSSMQDSEMQMRDRGLLPETQSRFASADPAEDTDQPRSDYYDRLTPRRPVWPEKYEAAVRNRLDAGRDLTDEAELADIEERYLLLEEYFARRAVRTKALMATTTVSVEPPPRDDWLALIDALMDVGDSPNARSELSRFVERWPDHPLDARQRQLLSGD